MIDDQGIIEMCKAVAANPAGVFEYMDLSLNNSSIRSELFMQDLLMSDTRRVEVHWKELDSSRLFEIDEIDAIVDHFGVAAIIDKYLKEETLLPLIPFDVLLPNISFNDPILSDGLVSNVLDKVFRKKKNNCFLFSCFFKKIPAPSCSHFVHSRNGFAQYFAVSPHQFRCNHHDNHG